MARTLPAMADAPRDDPPEVPPRHRRTGRSTLANARSCATCSSPSVPTAPPCARAGQRWISPPTWSFGSTTPVGVRDPRRRALRQARALPDGQRPLPGLRAPGGPAAGRAAAGAVAAAGAATVPQPDRVVRAPRGRSATRGGGAPRRPSRPRQRAVDDAAEGSRFMLRKVRGAGVALEGAGLRRGVGRGPGPSVRLTGGPQELTLYLSGRRSAARSRITGSEEARAIIESAPLGI